MQWLKELCKLLGYIGQSAWREVKLMWGIVWVVGFVVPSALAARLGETKLPLFYQYVDLIPRWGWVNIAIVFALGGFIIAIGQHSYRLDEEKKAKLTCSDICIRNIDNEFFVRVKLTNTSKINDLTDITPYLDFIEADDPLHEIVAIDFQIPIYSQQRLRDRIIARDSVAVPVKPIRIRAQQWKWLELFQITDVVERQVHIFLPGTRHDIMTLPRMEFQCSVFGCPGKIGFSVIYEEIEGGWQVVLVNELGRPSEPIRPEPNDE